MHYAHIRLLSHIFTLVENYHRSFLFLLHSQNVSYDSFLREYAMYMPFGLSIAASFLPVLHEPQEFDMARAQRTFEEISKEGLERGGASVDAELRALVVDMYNLYQELNLDLTLVECGGDDGARGAVWQQAEMPNVTITT